MPYYNDPAPAPTGGGVGWVIHILWIVLVIAVLVWAIRFFLH